MKRFITLSVLALSTWAAIQACGPWERPRYDVFEVYDTNELDSEARLAPMYAFWREYAGENTSEWNVNELSQLSLDDLSTSDNPIVAAARARGDSEMLAYLRHLTVYLRFASQAATDTWQYPTRESEEKNRATLQSIANAARNYTGSRLKNQYALLLVRSMVHLGDAAGVVNYWNTTGSKLPDTVYKDIMRGLYAWSLLATGERKKAINEYAEMGDMASIQWLVYDLRGNLSGLKKEYATDAGSATLVYLVQDYINNMAGSVKNKEDYLTVYDTDEDIKTALESNLKELESFCSFALHVVREGKTPYPAMWQAAAGYARYLLGDTSEALKMLDKARNMAGTERMKNNARVCRIVASTAQADASEAYQNYLLGELKWFVSRAQTHHDANGTPISNYMGVLTNLTYDNLVPLYTKLGQNNLAGGLSGMMHNLEYNSYGEAYNFYCYGDYGSFIDKMSATQWIEYYNYLKGGSGTSLERWLAGKVQEIDKNTFVDLAGTKFLREGRYAEAIPYLEQVPLEHISSQGISRYMARRSYNVDRWFKRQVVDRTWEDIFDAEAEEVSTNQKLDYCREVLELEQQVATNPTPETMYRLASLYFQASYLGDCWYLTRYAHSANDEICYPDEKDLAAAAIEMLRRAKLMTDNEQLKQKCLYAMAFIPYGEDFVTYVTDDNYNGHYEYNYNCYYYRSMFELAQYYLEHNGNVAYYISHCDILTEFISKAGQG